MIIAVLLVLGAIFGSFVNAVVYRIHEQAALAGKQSAKAKKLREDLSISRGRSMCPSCHHTLAAKDLVPVLSWLSLRGKCRYCGARIPDSPIVEVLLGILFAVSYIAWPLELHGLGLFQFVVWLAVLVLFMALAVYDLRWFLLPDRLVLPVTVLAVVQVAVIAIWQHSYAQLWQPVLAAAIIFGLFWGLYQVSKGSWIGGGDVKLAAALGLLVATPLRAFLVIFIASLLGTIVSIPLLAQGKKGFKMQIPFGPYLLTATVVVVLFGQRLIDWYQNLFLL